jgi:hypothetical protein
MYEIEKEVNNMRWIVIVVISISFLFGDASMAKQVALSGACKNYDK